MMERQIGHIMRQKEADIRLRDQDVRLKENERLIKLLKRKLRKDSGRQQNSSKF